MANGSKNMVCWKMYNLAHPVNNMLISCLWICKNIRVNSNSTFPTPHYKDNKNLNCVHMEETSDYINAT